MKGKIKMLGAALLFVLVSCAVITVNIYFPEKDVKEAYKNLEKELMKPGTDQKKPEAKPESSIRMEFVSSAYAQEPGLADRISEIIKKMPDVVTAYKQMGDRLTGIDGIRDRGAIGEARTGLLVGREGSLSPAEQRLVDQENENRKTVIRGMAKAIVRINRLPENEANLNQVMAQATEQFAAIRRDSAKKGWWIQDSNGNWTKK
jgi:uncharacterized protein YdbL (DUF1318 family)